MAQVKMLDSEVPLTRERARKDLIDLLQDNVEEFSIPADDRQLIMNGWLELCRHYAPIFFEKSPHHLLQWSALKLILECREELSDVDFFLLGLVRNPMDTLYSSFTRFNSSPEKLQYQWLAAYSNLLKLKELLHDQLLVVRYEDIVQSSESLRPLFEFCGVDGQGAQSDFHARSIQKWRSDKHFGFQLSKDVVELALEFGYKQSELANRPKLLWPVYREFKVSARYPKKLGLKARSWMAKVKRVFHF